MRVRNRARPGMLRVVLVAFAAGGLVALPPAADAREGGYRVIVHPSNPAHELERAVLERAFLKKLTRWPDGSVIRPVDQLSSSRVRSRFAEDVLGRPVPAVRNYWQQAIFSGRDVPPPELGSDAAVVAYVLRTPGAVGYVSPAADVEGARLVEVR